MDDSMSLAGQSASPWHPQAEQTSADLPVRVVSRHLKSVRAWEPQRLQQLMAALDPDGDGQVDAQDASALVEIFGRNSAICPEPPASPPPPPPPAVPDPSPPPPWWAASSSALQKHSMPADEMLPPAFVRGLPPPGNGGSTFYFRPDVAAPSEMEDAVEKDVFEKCAERCLGMGAACWYLSISVAYRDCSIYSGLFKFTSQSV